MHTYLLKAAGTLGGYTYLGYVKIVLMFIFNYVFGHRRWPSVGVPVVCDVVSQQI